MKLQSTILLILASSCFSQRSPYAGKRPIGYPAVDPTTAAPAANDLSFRFGDGDAANTSTTSTERLPIEALGNRELINKISKMPLDSQPFWYLNWKALEKNRRAPQNYPMKSNDFVNRVLMSMQ